MIERFCSKNLSLWTSELKLEYVCQRLFSLPDNNRTINVEQDESKREHVEFRTAFIPASKTSFHF